MLNLTMGSSWIEITKRRPPFGEPIESIARRVFFAFSSPEAFSEGQVIKPYSLSSA
jgi:hypothetical protein